MISLTITDSQDSITFNRNMSVPIILSPIIAEKDVTTIDGNISTYYGSTKRQYQISFAWLDSETYKTLLGFRDRQYSNLKYPVISISGAENLNVQNMTAKISLNEQRVTNACGIVEDVTITFRESKQLP